MKFINVDVMQLKFEVVYIKVRQTYVLAVLINNGSINSSTTVSSFIHIKISQSANKNNNRIILHNLILS